MPFTASAGQQAALPTNNGNGTLTTATSLTNSAVTGALSDITGVLGLGVHIKKFGTLTGDCSATLQISVDGSNYLDFKTYTNAQIALTNGFYDFVQVKAVGARIVLTPGTMTGANGLNTKFLI